MVKTNAKLFPFCNELVHCRLFSILSSNIKNDLLLLLLFTSNKTSNFDFIKTKYSEKCTRFIVQKEAFYGCWPIYRSVGLNTHTLVLLLKTSIEVKRK